jgi:hypothetical protein
MPVDPSLSRKVSQVSALTDRTQENTNNLNLPPVKN